MDNSKVWRYDVNEAIIEARRRRVKHRQHFAVVQLSGGRVGVRALVDGARVMWSTLDDCRGSRTRVTRAKLEPSDAPLIRQLRADGMTYRVIADKFDISIAAAHRTAVGINWPDDRS